MYLHETQEAGVRASRHKKAGKGASDMKRTKAAVVDKKAAL